MMFGGAAGIFAVRAHRAAVAATRVCKDDPHGTVAANGYTCAEVLHVYADDCGAASAVPGATVADLCPLTCKSHQKSPCYESCEDDPHGTVAANGYTCAEVLHVYADDCGAASAVPGATVADLCPLTCKSHQK